MTPYVGMPCYTYERWRKQYRLVFVGHVQKVNRKYFIVGDKQYALENVHTRGDTWIAKHSQENVKTLDQILEEFALEHFREFTRNLLYLETYEAVESMLELERDVWSLIMEGVHNDKIELEARHARNVE